jgi:glycosyltransferase involved in cell wall biosynthesis
MKLAVIVPYRNREEHLIKFIPYITNYLSNQIKEYKIVIVEQSNEEKFNRGTLINIGFDLVKSECDYIAPHDVDLLPEDADYSPPEQPTHLAAYRSQADYKLEYSNFFGGVNLFLNEHFSLINGFSNCYAGYGAEDDDLLLRCSMKNLKPTRRPGRYTSLDHAPLELTQENRKLYYDIVNNTISPTIDFDGISSLDYTVLGIITNLRSHNIYENVIHYTVDFKNASKPN